MSESARGGGNVDIYLNIKERGMASSGGRMKYRKKPVVVKAEQFDPERPVEEWPAGVELAPGTVLYKNRPAVVKGRLRTLEGYVDLRPGDWIVTGIKGEKYPVRDDIFRVTYEPVTTRFMELDEYRRLVAMREAAGDDETRAIVDGMFYEKFKPVEVGAELEPEEKWIEEIARPLLFGRVTHCPFCRSGYGPILAQMGKVCEHYRRNMEIAGDDRTFAVFEGTPSWAWNTYLWKDARDGGPVRILAGGPEWFEVKPVAGKPLLARRRDLSRIPYLDGIILSSKNSPLGEDKAADGALVDIVEEARQVRAAQEQERIRTGDDMAKLTPEREAEICEKFVMKMETVTVAVTDNPSVSGSVRRALEDVSAGRVRPIEELWDDIEPVAVPEVKIIIDRREDDRLHRTILQGGELKTNPASLTDDDMDADMLVVSGISSAKTRKLLKWLRKRGLV